MPRSFSGIQRQALSLYRRSLRAARAKDRSGVQEEGFSWQAYARAKFEEHRGLKPIRDHMLVEYHMRRGQKALELFSKPECTGVQQS